MIEKRVEKNERKQVSHRSHLPYSPTVFPHLHGDALVLHLVLHLDRRVVVAELGHVRDLESINR